MNQAAVAAVQVTTSTLKTGYFTHLFNTFDLTEAEHLKFTYINYQFFKTNYCLFSP